MKHCRDGDAPIEEKAGAAPLDAAPAAPTAPQ
jgi:hypothetical protein